MSLQGLSDGGSETEDGGGVENPLPPSSKMTFEITGLKNVQGKVLCAVYPGAEGFPSDNTKATATLTVTPVANGATCQFQGLPPGEFAFAFIHDENNNDKLDQGAFGIPTEAYGVSNNAKGLFGPPAYADAKFQFDGVSFTQNIAAL